MTWLLLIIPGGTAAMTVPFLIARALVYRDTDAVFRASVVGEVQVANAEAAARERAASAAQLDAAHHHTAGWGGVPGECGVECACGLTYDGFDTIAEAAALLDNHIARETGRRQKEMTR
ncbi:hypothetical protein JNW88_29755 [Micromonospora sp. ATA32]|nr:hypothetical protein [Micromonospora sp. ATA32]